MGKIKYIKDAKLNEPVMIAGWPGMGSVALGAVDYLQRKLKAVKFAEISVDPLSVVDSVSVEDGVAVFSPIPKNAFYYTRDPDMIIFKGEAQIPGREGIFLLKELLDLALKHNVRRIYTGAAFPLPVSYKDTPQIYTAVNRKAMRSAYVRSGFLPMDNGHISGLNGLMLGFAQNSGIDAVCLLASMPHYAIALPNPKASAAIIDAMRKMLGFEVDMSEMSEYVKDMDEKMSLIEDKVKETIVADTREPEGRLAEKVIPPYIADKIEKMFADAAGDKGKAIILKKELDRWDLYKKYEDRFLDLFKYGR